MERKRHLLGCMGGSTGGMGCIWKEKENGHLKGDAALQKGEEWRPGNSALQKGGDPSLAQGLLAAGRGASES
ncbi:hypothetical protein GOP47_0009228 [Adiantum capillus-veneris]|uniref:Uncharacterized protein n=1 Tax=Adiantum capillus-veneris TaxID=13818 RepID=A0A9D4UWP2_ADICA|nr:hypothetical protein GOP47_0009228 [Adiantum capillus-veneris]